MQLRMLKSNALRRDDGAGGSQSPAPVHTESATKPRPAEPDGALVQRAVAVQLGNELDRMMLKPISTREQAGGSARSGKSR
jgi:hypothetical protein